MGINREESEYTVSVFIAQTGFTHPVLMDQTASVYQMYQLDGAVSPFPLDYIVDRNGIIRYGLTDYDPAQMQITIDLLLIECDPIASVTAYRARDQIELRWPGMASGEYQIFTAASPDASFPDNWTLEATLPATGNPTETYTDQAAFPMKKFYTIVHHCP